MAATRLPVPCQCHVCCTQLYRNRNGASGHYARWCHAALVLLKPAIVPARQIPAARLHLLLVVAWGPPNPPQMNLLKREALKVIARSLPPMELAGMREMFQVGHA